MTTPTESSAPEPIHRERGKPIRLHLAGHEAREGWTLLNAQQRPGVDVIGTVTDLSMFADNTVTEAYASHVYEHLGYQKELPTALREVHRILVPGGLLRVAVPDLEILAKLFVSPQLNLSEKFHIQRMVMGGQIDDYDFHKTAFSFQILGAMLHQNGFENIRRVPSFNLFKDMSETNFGGVNISLNVQCTKKA